jgi:hypothetical protein
MSKSQSKPPPPLQPIFVSNLAPISEELDGEKPYYIGKGNNH